MDFKRNRQNVLFNVKGKIYCLNAGELSYLRNSEKQNSAKRAHLKVKAVNHTGGFFGTRNRKYLSLFLKLKYGEFYFLFLFLTVMIKTFLRQYHVSKYVEVIPNLGTTYPLGEGGSKSNIRCSASRGCRINC